MLQYPHRQSPVEIHGAGIDVCANFIFGLPTETRDSLEETTNFATSIAAFGVVAAVSRTRKEGDVEELAEYRGLAFHHPELAAVLALALVSLIGIPLTAGFIAKFLICAAAARSGLWWLLIVGGVNSGISEFYYLRVLVALY